MAKKNTTENPKAPTPNKETDNVSENGNDNNNTPDPKEEILDIDALREENERKIAEDAERRKRETAELFDSFTEDDEDAISLDELKELIQSNDSMQDSIDRGQKQKAEIEQTLLETKVAIANVDKELKIAQLQIASDLVSELTPALEQLNEIETNVSAEERENDKGIRNLSNAIKRTAENIATTFNKYSAPIPTTEDAVLTTTNTQKTSIQRGALPNENDEDAIFDALEAEDALALELSEKLLKQQQEISTLAQQINSNKEVLERRQRVAAEEKQFAASRFIKDVINDLDSLEMSVGFLNDDMRNENATLKTIAESVETTLDSICTVFNKHGVTQINPMNQIFDENKHQAWDTKEVDGVAPETVVDVFQKGYEVEGRLIRHARVLVTPPKA